MADDRKKSLPTAFLDELLDEERAAAEIKKAIPPDFEQAAADLRRDMNIPAGQRLFDWQHLADEGEVGVADPEELRRRIEARFGAPSEPRPEAARDKKTQPGVGPVLVPLADDTKKDTSEPGSDTIQDVNPLAGKWTPQDKNPSGPINVGGQTGKLGIAPPVGAVVLPPASPNDETQLIPRKQLERRRRRIWMVVAAAGIAMVIGGVAFMGGGGDDQSVSVGADAGPKVLSGEPTATATHVPAPSATAERTATPVDTVSPTTTADPIETSSAGPKSSGKPHVPKGSDSGNPKTPNSTGPAAPTSPPSAASSSGRIVW